MTLKATAEQWRAAQEYEEKCWLVDYVGATDDRSGYYLNAFDEYAALPPKIYRHVLEIGCGPFTQSKIISHHAPMESVTLVDPLLDKYMALDKCSYRPPLSEVPAMELVAARGEDFCRRDTCDLAICINVLPHCQDALKVVANLIASIKPGGILVFGEPAYPDGFDGGPGHPITPPLEWLREQVSYLETLYQIELPWDNYTDFCFIGRKPEWAR